MGISSSSRSGRYRPMLRRSVRFVVCTLLFVGVSFDTFAQSADAPSTPEVLPSTIPIFPLQEIMLFPHVGRPLHIFEPRYREMLADALEGDRIIGMVMLRPGHEADYFGHPPIYPVGCAGVIANVETLPDGRYNVVLQGISKFRVKSEDQSRSYRLAEVETISESLDDGDSAALNRHRPRLMEALSSISPGTPPAEDELPDEVLVNLLAQYVPMEPRERLELLELDGPLARADALVKILRAKDVLARIHGRREARRRKTRVAFGAMAAPAPAEL